MRYAFYYLSNPVGFYELNPFPGCNQLTVSNHAFIAPEFRGKGLGDIQHKQRLHTAKVLGYDYMICTVNSENEVEKKILVKNNWVRLDTFRNSETGNNVEIWGRVLDKS